jgi:hypothetical protein
MQYLLTASTTVFPAIPPPGLVQYGQVCVSGFAHISLAQCGFVLAAKLNIIIVIIVMVLCDIQSIYFVDIFL